MQLCENPCGRLALTVVGVTGVRNPKTPLWFQQISWTKIKRRKKMKTKVREIIFVIVEHHDWLPQRLQIFKTWGEVNKAIEEYQTIAPDNGAYDKCDYKVTWEDDQSWKSRYDMQRKSQPLNEDVRDSLTYYSGRLSDEELSIRNLSREEYTRRINTFWDKETPEDIALFMDTHELD